ncbi:hypothetical protein A5757_16145 [Mycobacterium sp. 852013-51886_SCH5428379]|nr:hypothetical protein A5757_16145 [Mycobacterium sp. 852013-51886_SCH5428379]
MPSGADGADKYVDRAELSRQLLCQTAVGVNVIGVVVLIRVPRARVRFQDLDDPVASRLLPSACRMRFAHDIDIGTIGGKHPRNDRFQAGVCNEGYGMAVYGAR